nr:hypothetical protein Ade03nite_13110 [Actinoplanes derwentensis]
MVHLVRGEVRRAQREGQVAPPRMDVDGDHRAAQGDRGHHRAQADTAGAVDRDGVAGGGPQDVEDGPGAGLDAAAERRGEDGDRVGEIFTTLLWYATAWLAKLDCPKKPPWTGEPSGSRNVGVPRMFRSLSRQ